MPTTWAYYNCWVSKCMWSRECNAEHLESSQTVALVITAETHSNWEENVFLFVSFLYNCSFLEIFCNIMEQQLNFTVNPDIEDFHIPLRSPRLLFNFILPLLWHFTRQLFRENIIILGFMLCYKGQRNVLGEVLFLAATSWVCESLYESARYLTIWNVWPWNNQKKSLFGKWGKCPMVNLRQLPKLQATE